MFTAFLDVYVGNQLCILVGERGMGRTGPLHRAPGGVVPQLTHRMQSIDIS